MKRSTVTGLSDARRVLKKLPERTQKRVLGSAVRSGATILRKELKKAAPTSTTQQSIASQTYGHLKDNIRIVKLKRDLPKSTVAYRVDTGDAFWGYMLEFGTSVFPAMPWFRPVIDARYMLALSRIRERLVIGIEREAVKLSR